MLLTRTWTLAVFCGALLPLGSRAAAQTEEPVPAATEPAVPAEPAGQGEPAAEPEGEPATVDPTTIAGSLAVRAVQGTKDAPAVGETPVEVQIFHRNQPIDRIQATLDEHGVVVLEGLPVGIGITPVVKISYAGVTYQEVGPAMGPDNREAAMDVVVYETTDEAPDWHIVMRHVLVEPRPDGAAVSDMIIVESKADRTWLGGLPDLEGKRTAVTAALPAAAKNVQLIEGFHGWCCTKIEDGALEVQMPLMPGRARFNFSYEVPTEGGKADLSVAAPKRIDQMALFIPDDGTPVEAVGLESGGVSTMGQTPVRLFQAQGIAAGEPTGLVLARAAAPAGSAGSTQTAQIIAAVGMGVLLVTGAAVLLLRRSGPREAGGGGETPEQSA